MQKHYGFYFIFLLPYTSLKSLWYVTWRQTPLKNNHILKTCTQSYSTSRKTTSHITETTESKKKRGIYPCYL